MPFSRIYIIYNPNSTGSSKEIALDMVTNLKKAMPGQSIEAVATEFAKHAESLAYDMAKGSKHPLIISASGDGGYNEVVNGIMRASQEGFAAVAGLLPAGNANDHYNSVHEGDFVESVISNKYKTIDLLKLEATSGGKSVTRYAHSYIGFGLTPKVGHELTKTKLNAFNEKLIVIKFLFAFGHTTLIKDGRRRRYHSLVLANIGRMAKILSLAKDSDVADGKFEVSSIPKQTRFHLIAALLKASLPGFYESYQATSINLKTVRTTLVQLDGEVMSLDANTAANISVEPKTLSCIV